MDELVDEAVKLGEKISGMSKVAIAMAKMAVNASNNLSLDEGKINFILEYWYIETIFYLGLRCEKRLFHSTFATQDQKVGMTAFLKKQKPEWTDS